MGGSLRQSPMPPRDQSFGSLSRQGASKGPAQSLGPREKAPIALKAFQSEKFFSIQPSIQGQTPVIKKTNIRKPTSNEKL